MVAARNAALSRMPFGDNEQGGCAGTDGAKLWVILWSSGMLVCSKPIQRAEQR